MAEENQQNQQNQQQADWRAPYGADAAPALKEFKEPGDFYKAFNTTRGELDTLKKTPFDWRKAAATVEGKDDETLAKALARYNDLPSVSKALVEAQNKIRSGELAKPLAKDAKPEEIAAWRTANGIPNEVKGYFENMPSGLVIGKDDQPVFDAYGKLALEHNAPPALMHAFTKMYYDQIAQTNSDEAQVDKADAQQCITELRNEMGNDYDVNKQILNNWLEGAPGDLKDLIKDATLGNGTRLFNDSNAMKFLMQAARQLNPAAHLIPAGGEGLQSLDSELTTLRAMMGDKTSKYWKGPDAEKNQKRYRDLTAATLQMKKAS